MHTVIPPHSYTPVCPLSHNTVESKEKVNEVLTWWCVYLAHVTTETPFPSYSPSPHILWLCLHLWPLQVHSQCPICLISMWSGWQRDQLLQWTCPPCGLCVIKGTPPATIIVSHFLIPSNVLINRGAKVLFLLLLLFKPWGSVCACVCEWFLSKLNKLNNSWIMLHLMYLPVLWPHFDPCREQDPQCVPVLLVVWKPQWPRHWPWGPAAPLKCPLHGEWSFCYWGYSHAHLQPVW